MEKFLKSIFTTEKKKACSLQEDSGGDREDFTPPLDGRRKLSISRSGRMKQANKHRHELSLDLYGEEHNQYEKPRNKEYHVSKVIATEPNRQSSLDRHSSEEKRKEDRKETENRRHSGEITPEEEIENAFEIIDKIS